MVSSQKKKKKKKRKKGEKKREKKINKAKARERSDRVGEFFAHYFFCLVSPINGGGGGAGPLYPL